MHNHAWAFLLRGAGMSKPKKQVFSKIKAVKANARERIGTPPAQRVLPDPKRSLTAKPKYKPGLADLLSSDPEA